MRTHIRSKLVQICLLVFLLQFLAVISPFSPHTSFASPSTYRDIIWGDDEAGNSNDNIATAYYLGGTSVKNDPNTPLNVSSWSPDYYNFTVSDGFYFSVFIEFDQSIAYNTSGQPVVFPTPPPPLPPLEPFLADIDIAIIATNSTILDTSDWSGNEEVVGPILVDTTQVYTINVTAVNYEYETIQYSTTYNMSVILEDVYEVLDPNDNWNIIDDPRYDDESDDEITPGSYPKLRFSTTTGFSDFGKHDWYLIWLYNNTDITLTVTGYLDGGSPEPDGPNFYIYDQEAIDGVLNQLAGFTEDGNDVTDKLNYYTNYSGWYYLHFDNSYMNTIDYYELNITTEDSYEGGGNNVNSSAVLMSEGHYPGLVTSTGFDDWYKVQMDEGERLLIQIHWFSFIGTLQLALYENESASSIVGDAAPIFRGLRIGPHRAEAYNVYLIHISGDNSDPRYYNLTIIKDDVDDWAEDNDDPVHPYMLLTESKVYRPTLADPFGGFFSQEGDLDYFAISLLAGDLLTIRIDFNGTLGDLNLFLGDSNGYPLDSSVLSPSNFETVSYRIRKADVYIFLVGGVVGSYASIGVDYNMTVNILEYDDKFESNDDASSAAPIAEGEYDNLILRDDDYFYLYLYASDVIEINLTYFPDTYTFDGKEYLNDIDLDLLYGHDESLANRSQSLFNESLSFVAPTNGMYYIVCVIYGNSNQYNLSINVIETDDAYEDNDDLEHATRIHVTDEIPETSVTHQETNLQMRVKDDDYFVVNVPAGLVIIVDLTFGTEQNLDLELLDPNGFVIDSSSLTVSTAETVGPFLVNQSYNNDFNGSDVYIRVFMEENLATSYVLSITIGREEILLTRETTGDLGSTTPPKTLGLLEELAPLVVGGSIIGGGGAGILYAGKKTGVLDKGIGKLKDWRSGRGGTGTRKGSTPKKSRRKPPS